MIFKILIFLCFYAVAILFIWIADSLYFDIYNRYDHMKVVPIYLGSGLGIALTIFFSFLIIEKIRFKNSLKFSSLPIITTYILIIIILPFAFAAGVVGGGTFGGGLFEMLFSFLNLNTKIGIPIGIGLGIFFVSLIVVLPILFFGYFLGKGLSKLITKKDVTI